METGPSGPRKKGVLYVVAPPIGNLEDVTRRALRTLGEVEAVACEDTRQTLKLLTRHGIRKRLISYYRPRENQRLPEILRLLESGRDVALVSDAGTPGISDPGFPLIREALRAGIRVVPIPGPCAATAALSAAGLPTHRFLFVGFPPPKRAARRKFLAALREEEATLVIYLPTRKLGEFLEDVPETLGDRSLVIAREMTKIHEEFIRGKVEDIKRRLASREAKGEATVLISRAKK
jgi:16S rRNA (cytidine1402-2'-O)-methyltransferase